MVRIDSVDVAAFTVPTDAQESDGTLEWSATTIIVVHAHGGGETGMGYSYASAAAAGVVEDTLTPVVIGLDTMNVEAAYVRMLSAVRNIGRPGIASCAVSAVDVALWELKARLLGLPMVSLIGAVRGAVPVYGSGGFTSYSPDRLVRQLDDWVGRGFCAVKMKVGRDAGADRRRVSDARRAIGDAALYVDANGAYDRKLALAQAEVFAAAGVSWFEEPVSSDDLKGLRLLRNRAPAGMDIAAGEYGYTPHYFNAMAPAVDVLQADATRCGGVTGFLRAGAICDAWSLPLSSHTAPSLHAHLCCAVTRVRHLEYFHDHVRIERMLFDGVLEPTAGELRPDLGRAGLGLALKRQDAARYAA